MASPQDPRFVIDDHFGQDHAPEAGPSNPSAASYESEQDESGEEDSIALDSVSEGNDHESITGMDPEGFAGPSRSAKSTKTLTPEALAAFRAAQERTGVIYISRIPPGMRPTKVRYLMSQFGEVGRVYLQQEDAKSAYLRRKYTSTKKVHYTEGWVEFTDKRVARSVAAMLNAQPIGGKKGTRWRDDVWTMKYLPKFKWSMLTEQIANEAAQHTARLRVEIEQSRREQKDYLRQVELARVLDKRKRRKREAAELRGEEVDESKLLPPVKRKQAEDGDNAYLKKKQRLPRAPGNGVLNEVLSSVF